MLSRRRERLRAILYLAVGLGMTALVLGAWAGGVLQSLELQTVDERFSIRGTESPPESVVVVPIDDVTFGLLGEQWPFPRSLHGQVIDRLAADGASVIAFDVQFTEPSDLEEDNALIESVAAAGNVVLATTEVDEQGRSNIFGGDEVLDQIGARAANALLPSDDGGIIRRLPYQIGGLETFAVASVEEALGRQITKDDLRGPRTWIDFAGPPGTLESWSYGRVLQGDFPPGTFRGKVVVVGPSAPSLQDVHPTSTSGDELMAGAEVQGNAIATALAGFPLQSAPLALNVLLVVLMGFVAPLASLRWNPLRVLMVSVLVGVLFAVGVQIAFEQGVVLVFVYPLVALALSAVGALAVSYLLAAFERERVRDVFSRFVPEQVVDEVLKRADDDLRLGGVRLTGTVLFSDLRGFTTFAETMPADKVIEVLNQYLGEMSDAILDNGGTLVAYMGDGIMAVFGAPIEGADHADRAVAAAREMLEVRLPRFNTWMRDRALGDGFRMGIGLNSGPLMSGNVGSARRLEYTAIGDTTNTASRIEGMTKGTPHAIFIAESTREYLTDPDELTFVDEFEVRGRQAKIRLWTLGSSVPAPPPETGRSDQLVSAP